LWSDEFLSLLFQLFFRKRLFFSVLSAGSGLEENERKEEEIVQL